MVLDVSIEENEQPVPEAIRVNPDYVPDLFTVHVDSKRILTVLTDDDGVASKWLTEVVRTKATNTKPPLPGAPTTFPPDAIFVGLVAEEHEPSFGPSPFDSTNNTLDLLTLCVGSHCLMFELPGSRYYWEITDELPYDDAPKLVKAFFQNPRVVVVGTDMAKVTKRLEARHGVKVKNAVDLNQLAVKGMQRHDLDLARYGFDKLTMTVLGKEFDVIKPEPVYWYEKVGCYNRKKGLYDIDWGERLSSEKVMFNTVDAYLRLLMCFKLLEAVDGPRESSSSKKKKKSGKKKITKRRQEGAC
ncbi:hypothetical protein ACLB2K_022950 [Fragaria x ananassa]